MTGSINGDILLARVSSKQEHRPTYFVSDITHGPLNVPFSFAQPIALNYRVSRRDCGNIRVRNLNDIDTFRFVSSAELSAALVKLEKKKIGIPKFFKFDDCLTLYRFMQCCVKLYCWNTLTCHLLLNVKLNDFEIVRSSTRYFNHFYIDKPTLH